MTYIDFGPALALLGRLAPQLRSLATCGLALPPAPLQELAAGCPRLERLHLHAWHMGGAALQDEWYVSADELLDFLRACPQLRHLALSYSVLHQPALLTWLAERQAAGRPVASVCARECHVDGFDEDDPALAALLAEQEQRDPTRTSTAIIAAKLDAFKARACAINPALVCVVHEAEPDAPNGGPPERPQGAPSFGEWHFLRLFEAIDWAREGDHGR